MKGFHFAASEPGRRWFRLVYKHPAGVEIIRLDFIRDPVLAEELATAANCDR